MASDADDGLFWLVQARSHKSVTPFGVAQVAVATRHDVVESIARGGMVDRGTAEWNGRVMNLVNGSRLTAAVTASGKTGKAAEDLLVLLAKTAADDQRLPVRMPIHLLTIPANRPAEADLHERIVFQMLHMWDSVLPDDRRDLLDLAVQRPPDAATAAAVAELCATTAARLVELLLRARGQHAVAAEAQCPTPDAHLAAARMPAGLHASRFYASSACACGRNYYLTAVYRAWHERSVGTDVAHLLQQVACTTVQGVIITALLGLWEGLRAVQLTRRLRALTRTMSVRLVIPAHAHPLLNGTGASRLVDCTYQRLRHFLVVMQRFAGGAQCDAWERGFTVPLDGPRLRLFPAEDPVLGRWCDALHAAVAACRCHPPAAAELQRLFRGWDGGEAAAPGPLEAQAVAVAQSFMYYRHVAVRTVLSDELDDLPEDEPTRLTFGLATLPDRDWCANSVRIELFVAALLVFRTRVQETLRAELLSSPPRTAKRGKRGRGAARAPAAPLPPWVEEDDEEDEDGENSAPPLEAAAMPPLEAAPVKTSALPVAPPRHRLPHVAAEDRPLPREGGVQLCFVPWWQPPVHRGASW